MGEECGKYEKKKIKNVWETFWGKAMIMYTVYRQCLYDLGEKKWKVQEERLHGFMKLC